MNTNKDKILNDPMYINSRKYGYNIASFMKKNERGVPDKIISSLVCMTTEEVQAIYASAVKKLQSKLLK